MAKSYTQVSLYEKCPFAYHCKYKQKIKEPMSPALERGIKTHDICESYLKSRIDELPGTIHKAAREYIKQLKEMDAASEEFWHLNSKWEMVDDWDWLVVKMDAYGIPKDSVLRVVDFKTGKPYPTHKEQLHLYATAGFSVYDCETVESVALYLDTGAAIIHRWKLKEYKEMCHHWNDRIFRLETEKKWMMTPGRHCDWCSNAKSKGGICSYG